MDKVVSEYNDMTVEDLLEDIPMMIRTCNIFGNWYIVENGVIYLCYN